MKIDESISVVENPLSLNGGRSLGTGRERVPAVEPRHPVSARNGYASLDPNASVVEVKAPRSRLPWGRILAGAVFAVVASAAIGAYAYRSAGFETTDDAFLEGDVHPVSPRINGTVEHLVLPAAPSVSRLMRWDSRRNAPKTS